MYHRWFVSTKIYLHIDERWSYPQLLNVSFTINLEVMSCVGAQHNETFRGWYEMQRDMNLVETNGSKTRSLFEKVFARNWARQRYSEISLDHPDVARTYIQHC